MYFEISAYFIVRHALWVGSASVVRSCSLRFWRNVEASELIELITAYVLPTVLLNVDVDLGMIKF